MLSDFANWYVGVDTKGEPVRNPDKDPKVDGVLVVAGFQRVHQLARALL